MGPRETARFRGERTSDGVNELCRLRRSERNAVREDEAAPQALNNRQRQRTIEGVWGKFPNKQSEAILTVGKNERNEPVAAFGAPQALLAILLALVRPR